MAKMKDYIIDTEEQICSRVYVKELIDQSNTCEQAQNIAVDLLKDMSSFQLEIVRNYIASLWNAQRRNVA
tara:strand:+ start:5263 stop:5472 length:210 start_codon:yes stop_codon:yes gene_type:complete